MVSAHARECGVALGEGAIDAEGLSVHLPEVSWAKDAQSEIRVMSPMLVRKAKANSSVRGGEGVSVSVSLLFTGLQAS